MRVICIEWCLLQATIHYSIGYGIYHWLMRGHHKSPRPPPLLISWEATNDQHKYSECIIILMMYFMEMVTLYLKQCTLYGNDYPLPKN